MQKSSHTALKQRVDPEQVRLIPGKASSDRNGSARLYWHVYHGNTHAGHAIITIKQSRSSHPDASITVELNAPSRGLGIGSIAFRRACELSGLAEVIASVRKRNIASLIALKRAGFKSLGEDSSHELLWIWRKDDND